PAWSPDGKWLYFGTYPGDSKAGIYAIRSVGGDLRRLTENPVGDSADYDPAVAPDGRQLVFVRWVEEHNAELYTLELSDGPAVPRRITSNQMQKDSPVWTGDGREIVFI